jgi:hypothetical protein
MNCVGIVYDEMNQSVEAQVTRDFLLLSGEFSDLAYFDQKGEMSASLMEELGIPKTDALPNLYVVYKTGEKWPYTDPGITRVERDLKPEVKGPLLDCNPQVGYFLKPQGRSGANLTERYLNRSYPRGRGVVNPLMLLVWG